MTPHTVWIGGPPAACWFDPTYVPPKAKAEPKYVPPVPKPPKPPKPPKRVFVRNGSQLILTMARENGRVTSADVVQAFGIKRNASGMRLKAMVTDGDLAVASGGSPAPGHTGNVPAVYVLGAKREDQSK